MFEPSGIVTLLTDFGRSDAYVSAMKGVILCKAPDLQIVDMSHEVPAQDILRGAFLLADAAPWFPVGTVHVAVVDPGVGTERRAIVALAGGHAVVAPDNGLISVWLERAGHSHGYELAAPGIALPELSATFHGRDVFAPFGAALGAGRLAPEDCGPLVEPVRLQLPTPVCEDGIVRGEVLYADRFGNLVTSIQRQHVPDEWALCSVEIDGRPIGPICTTYGESPTGTLVALFGSNGHLEVGAVQGSASAILGAVAGTPVKVV